MLVSSQGRYLVTDDGRLEGSNEDDKLVKQIAKLDEQNLKDQIKAADKAAKEGKVKPCLIPWALRGFDKTTTPA